MRLSTGSPNGLVDTTSLNEHDLTDSLAYLDDRIEGP